MLIRFNGPEQLASYSGTTPRVHASGDKVRYGRLQPDANRYLKWAFSEAGNSVMVNRGRYPDRYAVGLYNRVVRRRGHATAIGAVARHLAELTYWILTKKEPYGFDKLTTSLERKVMVFADGSVRAFGS